MYIINFLMLITYFATLFRSNLLLTFCVLYLYFGYSGNTSLYLPGPLLFVIYLLSYLLSSSNSLST